MFRLFESIKVVDGQFLNLPWHQQRVNRSLEELAVTTKPDLTSLPEIPQDYRSGVVKCRVCYGETLGPVEFSKYKNKTVNSLQQVACEPFDYRLKYQDRSKLDQMFQLRGNCDEVLITIQDIITDTSYSNVLFYDGGRWYTPEQPILEGTQRALLLDAGKVHTAKIRINELRDFQKLVLINAMLEFDPEQFVPITNIEFWNRPPVSFGRT